MSTDTVTISKQEYKKLKQEASAYRRITTQVFESVVGDSADAVVADLHKTGLYSDAFLADLHAGLRKSSYHKA